MRLRRQPAAPSDATLDDYLAPLWAELGDVGDVVRILVKHASTDARADIRAHLDAQKENT